jgi:hypothetical protein
MTYTLYELNKFCEVTISTTQPLPLVGDSIESLLESKFYQLLMQ